MDSAAFTFYELTNRQDDEDSGIQDNYSAAPNRIYYRLTETGKTAADELWSNPLFTLYPENGANHKKKSE